MASIKQLKKELGFLSSQIIADCIDLVKTFNGKEMEAMAIIERIVELHNGTVDKINNPDGKDNARLVKAFYRKVKTDYVTGIDEAYKELENLVK